MICPMIKSCFHQPSSDRRGERQRQPWYAARNGLAHKHMLAQTPRCKIDASRKAVPGKRGRGANSTKKRTHQKNERRKQEKEKRKKKKEKKKKKMKRWVVDKPGKKYNRKKTNKTSVQQRKARHHQNKKKAVSQGGQTGKQRKEQTDETAHETHLP